MSVKSVQITVEGKVQGVGYRYYVQTGADSYNVKGFVKNMPDASVFIEAEGEQKDLEAFVDYCRIGPDWSNVKNMSVNEIPFANYKNFEIKY